jgi:hypothetical protein
VRVTGTTIGVQQWQRINGKQTRKESKAAKEVVVSKAKEASCAGKVEKERAVINLRFKAAPSVGRAERSTAKLS